MNNRSLILICSVWLTCSFVAAASPAADEVPELPPEDMAFFEKHVRPLLVRRCFECHGGSQAAGGLSLASADGWAAGGDSGPAVIPGRPDESLLIRAVRYDGPEMPPADEGGMLPDDEIAVLTDWVSRGAPDPRTGGEILGGMTREEAQKWWAFQPLPDIPAGDFDSDVKHIDSLLQRELDRRGIIAAPKADRRTRFRRLAYDLTGLPPVPEESDAFVADERAEAWSDAVEHFLKSPQYGVQWGRYWLDVVRYADTAGENTDRPLPHAWRYRNWVIDCFNRDLPFDQFVRLQIAGDLLTEGQSGPERAEGIIATGYLAIARRFGHDIDKDMYLTHEDVIDNLGRSFLGLSLGCARCHDHKYDAVTTEDYYALYGIFESTRFAFPGCEPKGMPRDLVPLLSQSEIDESTTLWETRVSEIDADKQRLRATAETTSEQLREIWEPSRRMLVDADVGEGGSEKFECRLNVRRGEAVLLTVSPNGNHGADSTLVDWTIRQIAPDGRKWSTSDIVPDLLKGNSWPDTHSATWSFLEMTPAGPKFLSDRRTANGGRQELPSWSLGSEPSVFVNSSAEPVSVWTSLPARAFFVHPGDHRPVGVAWTSPIDGEILLSGHVADAHPAGLDGVSFTLAHIAAPVGSHLADLSRAEVNLPDAGPPPVFPVAYAVADREAVNVRIHERGDPEKPGREIPRRWLTVFGGEAVPEASGSGRRLLSDQIADHPLTARVMVNRIWARYFGHGIVGSLNDFGSRGEAPTHPELLDFLASRFVRSGYSVRAVHRLILHTDAYQRQSAAPDPADPENRFLARYSRRRLSAEELRDSLLAASGALDLTPGESHPFPAEATWNFTQHNPFSAVYETNRRSAYLMVQRQRRHPFLTLFDGADPNASTPARESTAVPTQALYFMNDPFFHQQAQLLAVRLMQFDQDDIRLRQVCRKLFQRQPTDAERKRAESFLAKYPGNTEEKWSAFCRVLMAGNEFLFVD